jgi:hypothetical protein
MLSNPPALQAQFKECLRNKVIPKKRMVKRESMPPFLRKLEEKKQTKAQQELAAHAIALYLEILDRKGPTGKLPSHPKTNHKRNAPFKDAKQFSAKRHPFKPLVSHSPSPGARNPGQGASRQEKPVMALAISPSLLYLL